MEPPTKTLTQQLSDEKKQKLAKIAKKTNAPAMERGYKYLGEVLGVYSDKKSEKPRALAMSDGVWLTLQRQPGKVRELTQEEVAGAFRQWDEEMGDQDSVGLSAPNVMQRLLDRERYKERKASKITKKLK